MIRDKELGNLIAGISKETDVCGCIRLDKDFLWHFGLGDATAEDKQEIVDKLREAADCHVFVNEESGEPVYYVSRGFLRGGSFGCVPCKHVNECSKEKSASNVWFGMRCKHCTYDTCMLEVPGVRNLF